MPLTPAYIIIRNTNWNSVRRAGLLLVRQRGCESLLAVADFAVDGVPTKLIHESIGGVLPKWKQCCSCQSRDKGSLRYMSDWSECVLLV